MSDESALIPIEEELQPAPDVAADDDAEPEGAVEVQGRRMVDVSVVAAERKRARELAEKTVREKELAPLKEKADRVDQLEQALNAARPYVDVVRQHPELLQPKPPTPLEQQISDDDAAQEARDLQLYTAESKLDIPTAKKIIARRRTETRQAAIEAAREVSGPIQQSTAEHASRQNFAAMCSLRDGEGKPLVDPKTLAEAWVQLPAELTAHQQVAETVLNAAIGQMHRAGRRPTVPAREPVFSESPGGRGPSALVLTENAKKLGLTQADLKSADKHFVPDGPSSLGDW